MATGGEKSKWLATVVDPPCLVHTYIPHCAFRRPSEGNMFQVARFAVTCGVLPECNLLQQFLWFPHGSHWAEDSVEINCALASLASAITVKCLLQKRAQSSFLRYLGEKVNSRGKRSTGRQGASFYCLYFQHGWETCRVICRKGYERHIFVFGIFLYIPFPFLYLFFKFCYTPGYLY